MTLQERLRACCECEQAPLGPLLGEAADAIDAHERALAEIREVWAGSECGEPVYAQEAYAIRLCKQMYQIACDALSGKAPVAPDEVNRLSVRCESQRLKIDAQEARIKRLEEALRELCIASQSLDNAFAHECRFRDNERHPLVANGLVVLRTSLERARAALEDK